MLFWKYTLIILHVKHYLRIHSTDPLRIEKISDLTNIFGRGRAGNVSMGVVASFRTNVGRRHRNWNNCRKRKYTAHAFVPGIYKIQLTNLFKLQNNRVELHFRFEFEVARSVSTTSMVALVPPPLHIQTNKNHHHIPHQTKNHLFCVS